MDLNRIQVFLKIVESGNLTRAAKALGLPKSRVSRILSALEKDLGPLLHRTTREMRLTEAGTLLYERSKAPLDDIRSTIDILTQKSAILEGLIRVTAPLDLGISVLPSLVSNFQKTHPKVKLDILLSQHVVDLVRESIDIAIRIGSLPDSSYKSVKVGAVKLVLAASPHFLQRHTIKKLSDLENLPTLSFVGKNKTTWNLHEGQEKIQLKLNPSVTSNDPDILIKLALLHDGISLLPEFLCQEYFHSGDLVPLFRSWKSEAAPVHLLHPYKKEMPLRVRKFIDYLAQELPFRL